MTSADIRQHIKSAKCGNKVAFAELVRVYADRIFGLCLKLAKNRVEAEDLVQAVFFKAFRKIRDYDEKADLSTWLYSIAVNLWIDKKRRDKVVSFFTFSSMKDSEDDREKEFTDPAPGPETQSAEEELKTNLEKAVKELPEDQKTAVILRIYEGKSYEEIAKICGCSIGTVGSRLSRALIAMRNILKDS